jgi:hypothetical protein
MSELGEQRDQHFFLTFMPYRDSQPGADRIHFKKNRGFHRFGFRDPLAGLRFAPSSAIHTMSEDIWTLKNGSTTTTIFFTRRSIISPEHHQSDL